MVKLRLGNLRIILAFCIISVQLSCSNDLDVICSSKPDYFIYLIVNPYSEQQFIRIERSFIGQRPAMEMAMIFDSIYPKNLLVSVLLYKNDSLIGNVKAEETFEVPKDSGQFYYKKNLLFKVNCPSLRNLDSLRIEVRDTISGINLTGSTKITKPGMLIQPLAYLKQMSFFGGTFAIKWLPGSSYYNSLNLTFHYRDISDSSEVKRQFSFRLQQTFNSDTIQDYSLAVDHLMYVIASHINAVDDVIVRWMDSIDLSVQTCEKFLYDYSQIQNFNPSESALMYFTNLDQGYGVVSSKAEVKRTGYYFDRIGLDSLKYGRYTKNLKFSKYN